MTEPLWRQVFDALEREVAFRADRIVNNEHVADALGALARVRRLVRREATRTTRRWLHVWNVPAATDVTRVLAEVGQLRRQVGALHDELRSGEEDARVRAVES